jgi:5-formaminoimidazole-4-carboxamide-1-(beta)-D-ribofuranosyl 5'-monophosphate synthetase
MNVSHILATYDKLKITVGVLGGHSALDVCAGAKKYGFHTLAVCQKGREKTYAIYYGTHDEIGCIDDVIVKDKFSQVIDEEVQVQLRAKNTVFIHNRYFSVYCNFMGRESPFQVPIFGNREMLALEERNQPYNQYRLLEDAGIKMPKIFASSSDIDRLVIVKVNEAEHRYERAFFYATDKQSFETASSALLQSGRITKEDLDQAVIEEFIIGALVNFNFFYSPLSHRLELMGTDTRRQTNLDGLLRLPAKTQIALSDLVQPTFIETGHIAVTIKESLIEKVYVMGEKLVALSQELFAPGIIGPFALQGAVTYEQGKEEIVIFDVSLRTPGSPGTAYTPYTKYLFGRDLSYGERIAMELQKALREDRLEEVCT